MAELVDAQDLKSCSSIGVRVRPPLSLLKYLPFNKKNLMENIKKLEEKYVKIINQLNNATLKFNIIDDQMVSKNCLELNIICFDDAVLQDFSLCYHFDTKKITVINYQIVNESFIVKNVEASNLFLEFILKHSKSKKKNHIINEMFL